MANFQRVIRLYAQSEFVPAALTATGLALERLGQWQEAVDAYSQVVSEHANSSSAPSAQVAIGRSTVRLGDPFQGMIEMQRARNQYPGTEAAAEALDLLTFVFRFYANPRFGHPISFQEDAAFRPQVQKFKDVLAVRLSSTGIHVLERGNKRVANFDATGKLTSTQPACRSSGAVDRPPRCPRACERERRGNWWTTDGAQGSRREGAEAAGEDQGGDAGSLRRTLRLRRQ